MKQTLLYVFLLFNTAIFSQNAVAELKFEEAETAFNSGNYELTIQKVDEFESALGNITDKSLYLRVVSQNKLFNPANFYSDEKQFLLYNSLTANAAKYLKATENNGLNDKFKEVYAIGEDLKKLKLPKDKAAWQNENQRIKKEEQKKQGEIREKEEKRNQVIESFTIDDLPFGLTIEEFRKKFPNLLPEKLQTYDFHDGTLAYYFDVKFLSDGCWTPKFGKDSKNVHAIFVKDGKVIGFQKSFFSVTAGLNWGYKKILETTAEAEKLCRDIEGQLGENSSPYPKVWENYTKKKVILNYDEFMKSTASITRTLTLRVVQY